MSVAEVAPDLWRWTARHPDWHPSDAFGAEVASYALVADDELLLVDPLLPDGDDGDDSAVLERLDRLAGATKATHILITIGYHVRSAEPLRARYAGHIYGPESIAIRLSDTETFTILEPGVPGPAGAVAHAIGSPRQPNFRSGYRPTRRSPSATRSSPTPTASCACGPEKPATPSRSRSTAAASPRRSTRCATSRCSASSPPTARRSSTTALPCSRRRSTPTRGSIAADRASTAVRPQPGNWSCAGPDHRSTLPCMTPRVALATGMQARIATFLARRQYGAEIVESVGIYAQNPRLMNWFAAFNRAVEKEDRVPARLRDLAALKAATVVGCEFCMDIG